MGVRSSAVLRYQTVVLTLMAVEISGFASVLCCQRFRRTGVFGQSFRLCWSSLATGSPAEVHPRLPCGKECSSSFLLQR